MKTEIKKSFMSMVFGCDTIETLTDPLNPQITRIYLIQNNKAVMWMEITNDRPPLLCFTQDCFREIMGHTELFETQEVVFQTIEDVIHDMVKIRIPVCMMIGDSREFNEGWQKRHEELVEYYKNPNNFEHEYSGFTVDSVRKSEDVEREIRNMSLSELMGGSIGDTVSKDTICSDCGNTTTAGQTMHWADIKEGNGYVCGECWGNRGKQAML